MLSLFSFQICAVVCRSNGVQYSDKLIEFLASVSTIRFALIDVQFIYRIETS